MFNRSCLALALAAACIPATAVAQSYPARAVRMLVPFPPGGPNDILARVLAQKMSESAGQQFVVDNRGGAGGIIGTEMAAKAAPDGYTILLSGTAALSINPSLHAKLPYDPVKDFTPISLIATAPSILVSHPSLPVRTVKDVIALAKQKPGQLNYASAGIGTPPHLAGELFNNLAGVKMTHVPYKGGGPALVDLLSGHVQLYFSGISSALPMVKENKLKPIAVTSAKRTAVMPEMPTIAESGLKGYEVGNWYAILGPTGMQAEVVRRLNSEIVKALASADMRKRLEELGADPVGSTPEQLAAYMNVEIAKWAKVIKSASIKAE